MRHSFTLSALLLLTLSAAAEELPDGYWSVEKTQPILDAALRVTLDPDLSHLTEGELRALDELLAAGRIMHALFEEQRHAGAADARLALEKAHARSTNTATQNLVDLYYL
ncbi:MAG: NUDIX hydrolase, partial [Proteobacteria bacterium]|nr:NUDIX hydrolase [Pseudomonadota bacterium]